MDDLRSTADVHRLLVGAVENEGSQAAWSAKHGVSQQSVSHCMTGRRGIGRKIAQALGFEPVTMYAPIKTTKKGKAK